MVTRMRLIVALYVHCLFFLNASVNNITVCLLTTSMTDTMYHIYVCNMHKQARV
jgi:hypothetical protein